MRKTKTGIETLITEGQLWMDGFFQSNLDTDMFIDTIGDGCTKTIRLQSLSSSWLERVWIDGVGSQLETIDFEMTLRREIRSGKGHWYAYRRVLGTLYKRYVGTDTRVTQQRLIEVARSMPTTKIGQVKGKK